MYVTKGDAQTPGFGIGLPLSRRLARILGGELRAIAREVGEDRGSGCFSARTPVACGVLHENSYRGRRPEGRGLHRAGVAGRGIRVDVARDGDEATMVAHVNEYDLILLDVVLPGKNGFQIAAELRREGRDTPILMLTSRDGAEDVVRGLDAGADDYLAKPFRFDELLARIRALHRRGGAKRLEVLRYGPLSLDRLRHVASVDERRLDLTPREFQLLEYFLLHPEEVVRRTTLLEKVWDMHFDPESNVVDVHVGNLRRKIADLAGGPLVQTVRGVGFILRGTAESDPSSEGVFRMTSPAIPGERPTLSSCGSSWSKTTSRSVPCSSRPCAMKGSRWIARTMARRQ